MDGNSVIVRVSHPLADAKLGLHLNDEREKNHQASSQAREGSPTAFCLLPTSLLVPSSASP